MYKPHNTPLYLKAFAGFMGGITAPTTTETEPKNFALYAQMADAWAQKVDTVWGKRKPTGVELDQILTTSEALWENRSPLPSPDSTDPDAYLTIAESIVARVHQGNAQVVSEGIDPNDTGGGGGGGGTVPPFSSWLWVDQAAPSGGNGSVGKPFNTIAAANAAFLAKGAPSRANKFAVMLVPGIYPENVFAYPWIFIVGLDPFATRLTGNVALFTDPGNADNVWNPPDNPDGDLTDMRGGLVNVLLTNPFTCDFNVGPTPGSSHNGSNEGKFYLENCLFNSPFEMIGFSGISQGQARHTTFSAGFTITGANFQTEETNVTGGGGAPIIVQDNGSNLRGVLQCFGGATNGPVNVTSTAQPATMIVRAFSIQGAPLTLTGAQASYTAGPEGIPPVGSVILAGGAPPPVLSNDATALGYTPTVIANWSGVAPVDVSDALDRIAAHIGPIP